MPTIPPQSAVYVAGDIDIATAVRAGLADGDPAAARTFRLDPGRADATAPASAGTRFIVADDGMDERDVEEICRARTDDRTKLVFVYRRHEHFPSLYLRRGFRGLLHFDRLPEDLVSCLTILKFNGIYAPHEDIRRIFEEYCESREVNRIAASELEIVERIVAGEVITKIADDLSINYRSILNYIAKVRRQANIGNGKAELITHMKKML